MTNKQFSINAKAGKVLMAIFLMAIFCTHHAAAQIAVKTNLLYDAATTPNIGAEIGVGNRNTFSLVYGINPWTFNHNGREHKAKHWVLMPEYRWWLTSRYNGSFLGVNLMGGEYNVANAHLPIPGAFFGGDNLTAGVRHHRYAGEFVGVGATYGYQWTLTRHWNLEAELGVGYAHAWYRKYDTDEAGRQTAKGGTNYAGVTKLGVSIIYIF